MGAKIDVSGGTAKVTGVETLRGAPVLASALRASVSLILAGLAADGEPRVSRVYPLDRGYEQVVRKLQAVGAHIERGLASHFFACAGFDLADHGNVLASR